MTIVNYTSILKKQLFGFSPSINSLVTTSKLRAKKKNKKILSTNLHIDFVIVYKMDLKKDQKKDLKKRIMPPKSQINRIYCNLLFVMLILVKSFTNFPYFKFFGCVWWSKGNDSNFSVFTWVEGVKKKLYHCSFFNSASASNELFSNRALFSGARTLRLMRLKGPTVESVT